MQQLTIQEVESQTGLPRRTIHFYIKEGLIPPPKGSRRNAVYGSEHVLRLWLIQALKDKTHLRLEGIREILERMSIEETRETLEQLGSGQLDPLDIVARVRPSGEWSALLGGESLEEAGAIGFDIGAPGGDSEFRPEARSLRWTRSFTLPWSRSAKEEPARPEAWKRIRLGDDVEFQYRETDDEERLARIRELLRLAEEILK